MFIPASVISTIDLYMKSAEILRGKYGIDTRVFVDSLRLIGRIFMEIVLIQTPIHQVSYRITTNELIIFNDHECFAETIPWSSLGKFIQLIPKRVLPSR